MGEPGWGNRLQSSLAWVPMTHNTLFIKLNFVTGPTGISLVPGPGPAADGTDWDNVLYAGFKKMKKMLMNLLMKDLQKSITWILACGIFLLVFYALYKETAIKPSRTFPMPIEDSDLANGQSLSLDDEPLLHGGTPLPKVKRAGKMDGREDAASVSRAMAGSRLWTDLPGTRIFCLILAGDHEWGVKQEVVKQTWAQRCDNYCFFYSVHGSGLWEEEGACPLQTAVGAEWQTARVYEAMTYVQTHYKNKYDWILTVPDQTYIIMENLKRFLSQYKSSAAKYFGHVFYHEKSVPYGHAGAGAGFVLSAKALESLLAYGHCNQKGGFYDLAVAQCLHVLKIYPEDIRDRNGMRLAHPDIWTYYSILTKDKSLTKDPVSVLSPYSVSVHHIEPQVMYFFEFLIYRLHRGPSGTVPLPLPRNKETIKERPIRDSKM